jgi:hypothetical protein
VPEGSASEAGSDEANIFHDVALNDDKINSLSPARDDDKDEIPTTELTQGDFYTSEFYYFIIIEMLSNILSSEWQESIKNKEDPDELFSALFVAIIDTILKLRPNF